MKAITDFSGMYSFLDMKYPCTIRILDKTFKNAQAAFQSYKYNHRFDFTDKSGDEAYVAGHDTRKKCRDDWKNMRDAIITTVLMGKYMQNPDLKIALLNTGNAKISYVNNQGDTYWGVVDGVGEDRLGKITMSIRDLLIVDTDVNISIPDKHNLSARICVHGDTIYVYDVDGTTEYPLCLYRLACAYINMNADDFIANTDNSIKTIRYTKNILTEGEFVDILDSITSNFQFEDPDDKDLIHYYVKDAVKYYLRDLGLDRSVEALTYAGF